MIYPANNSVMSMQCLFHVYMCANYHNSNTHINLPQLASSIGPGMHGKQAAAKPLVYINLIIDWVSSRAFEALDLVYPFPPPLHPSLPPFQAGLPPSLLPHLWPACTDPLLPKSTVDWISFNRCVSLALLPSLLSVTCPLAPYVVWMVQWLL